MALLRDIVRQYREQIDEGKKQALEAAVSLVLLSSVE